MAVKVMIPETGDPPEFPVRKLAQDDWLDGAVVRSPNWLGDAAMTFPALMMLKKIIPPECMLYVVAPKGLAPVYEAIPQIVNKVIPLKDAHAFPSRAEFFAVKDLRAGIGVLFNNSFRDALWMKMAKIPKLYGTDARFRRLLLDRACKFPPRKDRVLNKPHQAAKNCAMIRMLGAEKWDGILPEMNPLYEPELVSPLFRKAMETEHLLAVAPGAAYGDAKRWDAEKFRQVCRWWIEEQHGKIVLVSGKNETESAKKTLEGLNAEDFFDLAGQTTLQQLMVMLRHASMCIANDSGAMHLAAILGTPGAAVFGSTDPAATSPVSSKWRMLYGEPDCGPCFKRSCPDASRRCFAQISANDAINAIKTLL